MEKYIVLLVIAATLITINIRTKENEPHKGLKILSYFFLSTLGFKASQYIIPIPTGLFLAVILIYRTKINQLSKALAAGLGLAFLIANAFIN